MYEEIISSDTLANFLPDFLEVQKQLKPVAKEGKNPFFNSKYEKLETVLEGVTPILNQCGFVLTQLPTPGKLVTLVLHVKSGEYLGSAMSLCAEKQTPQEQGAALTYARRQAIKSVLALSTEDTDGATETTGHTSSLADIERGKAARRAPASNEPHDFIIPFGRDKGKRIGDLTIQENENSFNWMDSNWDKQKTEKSDYYQALYAYLSTHKSGFAAGDVPF